MSHKPNLNKDTNQSKAYIKYSGLAFQILAFIFLGTWGGMKIDQWLSLKVPLFTIAFSMLALIGSLIYLVKSLPKS